MIKLIIALPIAYSSVNKSELKILTHQLKCLIIRHFYNDVSY